jgi:hypothetical protein
MKFGTGLQFSTMHSKSPLSEAYHKYIISIKSKQNNDSIVDVIVARRIRHSSKNAVQTNYLYYVNNNLVYLFNLF